MDNFVLILSKSKKKELEIYLNGHLFVLSPNKAMFWPSKNTLIIADLHLGKASHFRKNGLALSLQSIENDYIILEKLIEIYKPKELLILGDLFHSELNEEWNIFKIFREKHCSIIFKLVIGNHDILNESLYKAIDILVFKNGFTFENLLFTHEPAILEDKNIINIFGHIHTGYRLIGKARQAIILPCFYQKSNTFILPAFGFLTGLYCLSKPKNGKVYALSGDSVLPI